MKTKREPAEPLLRRYPSRETTLEKEGFLSALYQPKADAYTDKVLILVGGSDGYFSLTKLIAEQYVGRGLTVLALAYWNQPGLPDTLCHIPLEYAEKAAVWLRQLGYSKVGIAGVSMGAEYALLAASYFPELISCCVAISPISISTQGLQKKNARHRSMKLLEGSVFSVGGQDIPCGKLKFDKKQILKDSLRKKELCLTSCYDRAVAQAEGRIQAEKISGPVLLLAASQDSMWPSALAAEQIVKWRQDQVTEYEHYTYASHLLVPCRLKSRKMFRMERKFPDECWKSNLEAFQKTLLFLRNSW